MNTIRTLLVKFALVAFVVTKAVVPVGFMPTAMAAGSAFELCPANWQSAQLLRFGSSSEHHHHGHHSGSEHSLAQHLNEKSCEFSSLGYAAVPTDQFSLIIPLQLTAAGSSTLPAQIAVSTPYSRPHTRAPPASA